MRRLLALLLLLAFVAATAAPAIAACRMRAAQQECCCAPAPSGSLCAPDCCGSIKSARAVVGISTHVRGFVLIVTSTLLGDAGREAAPQLVDPATSHWLVGLHERAAPRRPLRV